MYANKKSSRKVALILLSFVLLVCAAIGGTAAYLMDQTTEVKNTFTSSDVSITLIETKPDGETAQMVPGATIEKDPRVTVLKNSEKCYVFVKIEKSENFDTYMTYDIADGWDALSGEAGVYYRIVEKSVDLDQPFGILKGDKVSVKSTVTVEYMEKIDGKDVAEGTTEVAPTLSFTAYAIQHDHLADRNNDSEIDETDAWATITTPANP